MIGDRLKAELRALLPMGFLRRAREDQWLFVSDYPRFSNDDAMPRLAKNGWRAVRAGDTLFLDLSDARYIRLAASLPPVKPIQLTEDNLPRYALVKWLSGQTAPPACQPVVPIRLTIKYLGTHEEGRLLERLPPLLAALKREGLPLPTAVASLMTNDKEDGLC